MTTPIAPISGIAPFIPFAAGPAAAATSGAAATGAAASGATQGIGMGPAGTGVPAGAAGAAGSSTVTGIAGGTNAAFATALQTALGGNPLAAMVNQGLVNPTAITGQLAGQLGGLNLPVTATSGAQSAGAGLGGRAGATNGAAPAPSAGGLDLGRSIGNGIDALQAAQHDADSLAVQAATGQLVDPAQLTIATTKAQLMTQVVTAVQSKAVTAFNTIMSMQA